MDVDAQVGRTKASMPMLTGRASAYWRNLEELSQTDDFKAWLAHAHPQASAGDGGLDRRRFLMLMGASLALSGITGCGAAPAPAERILPYVRTPEGLTVGRPLYFATAMAVAGDVQALLVASHEGRPTKVEGNPDHPANLPASECPVPPPPQVRFGPTDVFAQASLHTLYDPDRSQTVTHLGTVSTWQDFAAALRPLLQRQPPARVRIVTESVVSASLAHQLRTVLHQYPAARWHRFEPVGWDNATMGSRLAYGEDVQVHYRVELADVILALDADFLATGPGHVRHLRDFSERRRRRQGVAGAPMNRLYVVENMPSTTGTVADHRLPVRSSDIEAVARALAGRLDARFRALDVTPPPSVPAAWLDAVASDLLAHRGSGLIVVGAAQPAFVHALVHALNDFLGNTGRTVFFTPPIEADAPGAVGSLSDLVDDMDRGLVDVLLVLGGNPVYTAPADLRLAERLQRVPFRAHLGLYEDETSEQCHWHIPEAHYLEAWGDVRSVDGTVAIVQPLIAPLYAGKTISECLALFSDQSDQSSYDLCRAYWRSLFDPSGPQIGRSDWEGQGLLSAFRGDFETWWRRALHDGQVPGTALLEKHVRLQPNWMEAAANRHSVPQESLEIVFRPDPTVFDGRFANNGWLQELPKPVTKLTWDNAAHLSPATAVRLGLATADHPEQANERRVELEYQGRIVTAPAWVVPGHAENSITVHLGYGRTRAGRIGTGLGFNANGLRTWSAPWFAQGVALHVRAGRQALACTQHHFLMEGRDLVRAGTLQHPPGIPEAQRRSLTLYNEAEHRHDGEQWGMVIDLHVCTGCSACVVACQAENNIPVVGKDEVRRGREMHWIRVDRYHKGSPANPEMYAQPVPCMHCENAPCELVCPVGATVHSTDGLNDMVYNRCVGTRYCSNNCPYKVRRFNFFQYAEFADELARLGRNPEVTVRSRGVMEKCTYCVQRIRTAQIDAQRDDRAIYDGEVQTACQSACPAGAIIFGNLNDKDAQGRPRSKVAQLKREALHYELLSELNTRPRTTYLAALKNPNPALAEHDQR